MTIQRGTYNMHLAKWKKNNKEKEQSNYKGKFGKKSCKQKLKKENSSYMYRKKKVNKREDNQEDELKIEHWEG